MNRTRILLAGDTHGDVNHTSHLLATAARNDCNAIIIAGDAGYWGHTAEGQDNLDAIDSRVGSTDVVLYFIDGNHDNVPHLLATYGERRDDDNMVIVRPGIRYIPRGHTWVWAGRRYAALGGAYSVDKQWRLETEAAKARKTGKPCDRLMWWPEEEMTDTEADAHIDAIAEAGPVDVLLTHDRPERAVLPSWFEPLAIAETLPNQRRIQRALDRLAPTFLVHGHLHINYDHTYDHRDGRQTTVKGLACNPDGGPRSPYYQREDSRVCYDAVAGRLDYVP